MTSRPEQKAKVEFYYTSSTASLLVKKAVQSTRFLLHNKAIKYEEYDCVYDDERKAELKAKSGKTDLPQIFINGKAIGGYNELQMLEEDEKLNALLAEAPPS